MACNFSMSTTVQFLRNLQFWEWEEEDVKPQQLIDRWFYHIKRNYSSQFPSVETLPEESMIEAGKKHKVNLEILGGNADDDSESGSSSSSESSDDEGSKDKDIATGADSKSERGSKKSKSDKSSDKSGSEAEEEEKEKEGTDEGSDKEK